jgi:threonine aldolase
MLVSDQKTVERARSIRKLLGGQMRQAGVIAAAGIIALEKMVSRLAEDHRNASRLAEGLKDVPGLDLEDEPQTNIVVCRVVGKGASAGDFISRAWEEGVKSSAFGDGRIRFCLYRDISSDDVEYAIAALRRAAEAVFRV